MTYSCNAFYHRFIATEHLEKVMSFFEIEEQAAALAYVQNILNYSVWQLVCQLIPPEDYATFFSVQTTNFSDDSLIDWLQERNPEITMLLPEVLERSIVALMHDLESLNNDNS